MQSIWLPEWDGYLRYEDLPGLSPVCVYLAGLGLSARKCFAPVAAEPGLAAHRSLFIDLFGAGESDAPEAFDYYLEAHASTMLALLEALKLEGCAVIGASMGGSVAITAASLRPDIISKLVLLEGNLDPGGGVISRSIATQTEAEFCAHGHRALVEFLHQAGREGDASAAAVADMLQIAAPHALYRSAVGLVQGTQPTMRERLYQMMIPRTYIFGDRSLPDPDWEALPKHKITTLAVANAGHAMMLDNVRGTADAIKAAPGMQA